MSVRVGVEGIGWGVERGLGVERGKLKVESQRGGVIGRWVGGVGHERSGRVAKWRREKQRKRQIADLRFSDLRESDSGTDADSQ
jgi:hypothetical protein